MTNVYELEDNILPMLKLPGPCPIRIEVTDDSVLLFIGPRDFQWDKESGEWIGSGTALT